MADVTTPDPGRLLEDQKKLFDSNKLPFRAPLVVPEDEKTSSAANEVTFLVRRFILDGVIEAFSTESLLALLEPYVGKELTFGELREAADVIANHYRANGYFLATTVIPKQDVTEGVVRIVVFEGRFDRKKGLSIQGTNLRIEPSVLLGLSDETLDVDGPLHKETLERLLLLTADLPGMSATSRLGAGDVAGTTKVALQLAEGDLLVPALSANNFGNRYTGSTQVVAGLNVNDPLRYGDQLALNYSGSTDDLLHSGKVGYSFPVGNDGWRVGASYLKMDYRLAGIVPDPKTFGVGENWNLFAKYPIVRTKQKNLYLNLTYDWKDLYTESNALPVSEKVFDTYGISLSFDSQDTYFGGAFNMGSIGVVTGNLDLNKIPKAAQNDDSSAKTAGGYDKWVWSLARVQRITNDWSLLVSGTGQVTSHNLDGGEKFSLGGPTAIRAYPGGEGSGDLGYRVTVEPRWNVGKLPGDIELQFSAFYDWGEVTQNYAVWPSAAMTTPNTYTLAGCGISLGFIKQGLADFRVIYASKIGPNPGANVSTGMDSDGRNDSDRVWLSLTFML